MGQMKIKVGGEWVPVGGGGATVQPSEPVNPMVGQIWHDTDEPAPSVRPYYCHVEQVAGAQSLAAATTTVLTFDGVRSDDYGMFNGTNGIVIPVTGLYLISGVMGVSTSNAAVMHWNFIFNGVNPKVVWRGPGDVPSVPLVQAGSVLRQLNAGDVVTTGIYTTVARTTSSNGPQYQCDLSVLSITTLQGGF